MKAIIKGLLTTLPLFFSSVLAHALDIGEKAPLLTAESTHGHIDLTNILKEKFVILAFYYADFTPV